LDLAEEMQVWFLKNMIDIILRPSRWFASLMQISVFFAIAYAISLDASWMWWASSIFMYLIVYSMIGNNIALHRYFTHRHFTVSRPVEWLFLWTGSMIGLGEPISYAMTHVVHHRYSDTPGVDPHGPTNGLRSIFIWFQGNVDPAKTPIVSKHIAILSRKYGWLHKFYLPFVLVNAGILYLIDLYVFLFLWLIPAGIACWGIGWAVWRQHWHKTPNNSPLHRWDWVYEGLHLNHHLWPMAPNTAVRPNEIDWTYQFSKLFRPKYNMQGQPTNVKD